MPNNLYTNAERRYTKRVNEVLAASGVDIQISYERGRELMLEGRSYAAAAEFQLECEREHWRERGRNI